MPKQGLLMEEGKITQWLVKEGDKIEEGKPLFEMETDKLTITMDSTATGTVLRILHPAGDTVPITKPVAIVGEPGEDISKLLVQEQAGDNAKQTAIAGKESEILSDKNQTETGSETKVAREIVHKAGEKILSSWRARRFAEEKGVDLACIKGTGAEGIIIEKDVQDWLDAQPSVTPLAANIAKEKGISLEGMKGTGPNGKIMVADLHTQQPAGAVSQGEKVQTNVQLAGQLARGIRREQMSGMRRSIMRNMLASKNANAQTFHRISVDMTKVIALRKHYKELSIKVSYNDIIIRACAKALQKYPLINASVEDNTVIYHDFVNVGIAVAVNNGLIVPVIRDADIIGLQGIAKKSGELIDKARNGQLTDLDYHGGTFTVSSLGMYDLDDFVAIINPPESGILAVGKIEKKPIVETKDDEDKIVIKAMCTLCLSYDHRIINGVEGAEFLQSVKDYLQDPILLI